MKPVRITALRCTTYPDLMEQYENPMPHPCDVTVGQVFLSRDGQRPEGLCPEAWSSMEKFVTVLSEGGGNFFDGWMKDTHTAMISCNDGFRPVSFYIEALDEI